jgi:hypothetical protein
MQIVQSGHKETSKAYISKLESEIKELREILQDVLMCHAEEDKEVGYVQGMNSIAAAIVYNF